MCFMHFPLCLYISSLKVLSFYSLFGFYLLKALPLAKTNWPQASQESLGIVS